MTKSPAQQLGYELGRTYFSAYSRKTHKIIAEFDHSVWGPSVVSLWEDGTKTSHSTPLGKKDREVA